MLINALYDYCGILEQEKKLPPEGYEWTGISYVIALNQDGSLDKIIDVRIQQHTTVRGNPSVIYSPRNMLLPEHPRSNNTTAYFVERRGHYIFGLEYTSDGGHKEGRLCVEVTGGTTAAQRMKHVKQHQNFTDEVQKDFGGISPSSGIVTAYLNFAKHWKPEDETGNPHLLAIGADLNTAKFAFCLSDNQEDLLQDDPGVAAQWERMNLAPEKLETEDICQCAVTGNMLPVARVFDALTRGKGSGVKGAGINPSLASYKQESFCSYGHEQGRNACISEHAMKRATRALNWLLSDPGHHCYLDGLTLVYWAAGNEGIDPMRMLLGGNVDKADVNGVEQGLDAAAKDAADADISSERVRVSNTAYADIDYYIVALAPNTSRIQVKFINRQKLGKVFDCIARFQADLKVAGCKTDTVPLWRIKESMLRPGSNTPEELDTMFLPILRSIITGSDYPSWMLADTVTRVKKDRGDPHRLDSTRAGIIKACITRHTKEAISMGLDQDNTSPAYLCGRLFSVLEKTQKDSASPRKLNRTINDSYFSAAASNPAAVMPKLIRLSQHHITKLKKTHPDWAVNDSRRLEDIMEKLGGSFPGTLGLYDQGRFILGYYHQNVDNYTPKKKGEKNAEA